jgi:translation initiation factor 3 subunit D
MEPTFKEWSVATKTDWEMKREIMLGMLAKLQLDSREVKFEDVLWCGTLHCYNRETDRIAVRTERQIRRYENLNFFNVSTSDDPILPELLASDDSVTVIATDHVLSALIAAARSVYSWDIVITKLSNKLIFDKRDGSMLDFLTVNETAHDPPNNDDQSHINSPLKLGQEASCINQNFSQMVLDFSKPAAKEMDRPNPFEEEGQVEVASGAYRYRKITLPGNPKDEIEFNAKPVSLVVRTEVSCQMPGSDSSYVSVKALNEYDPKLNTAWRTHLESQRGAVLATELKNNAFKLGRWTAQAILGGCDIIKLGYASRVQPNNPWSHNMLGVQTHYTDGFAEQIGLTRNNAYGIIREIINLVMGWEDGKYLVLKDPTKSVLRFYEVPWEAFCDEDDDEDMEDMGEEEMQDLDEDGNRRPQQPVGPGCRS